VRARRAFFPQEMPVSVVAEFARKLHEKESRLNSRACEPVECPSRVERLTDIRALVFDVYGTLCNYRRAEFADEKTKEEALTGAFARTVEFFRLAPSLRAANAADPPEKTLCDFYHGLISLKNSLAEKENVRFPEIRIEEVWRAIILILQRYGYSATGLGLGTENETARCMAFHYNFYALGRGLYPGTADALGHFRDSGMLLGIVSNGQFYTPMDLTLFLRDEKGRACDDYLELFDPDLVFFSYEYGVAKPHQLLFRKLYDALYNYSILPGQVVFVGNDLALDIRPAQEAGMRTAFFTGDRDSAYRYDLESTVVPDIAFSSWGDLKDRVFMGERPVQ
jgi:putative hydrolase of the HAD superfamily